MVVITCAALVVHAAKKGPALVGKVRDYAFMRTDLLYLPSSLGLNEVEIKFILVMR